MGGIGLGGQLSLAAYTVDSPVELVGEPYFRGQPDRVIVHPNTLGDGVWFKHKDMRVPLKMTTLHATQERSARFLTVQDFAGQPHVWKVVEHTLAALFGALGADASAVIEVPGDKKQVYLPVLGPGIKQPFDTLVAAKVPLDGTSLRYTDVSLRRHTQHYEGVGGAYVIECDQHSTTYTEFDAKIGENRVMKFSEGDPRSPTITVHSSAQPDVSVAVQLHPQPYTSSYTPEALQSKPDLLGARALARMENIWIDMLFNVLQPILKFQGVSENNYFMATPYDTGKSLLAKMQPAFQATQNEWLAHTVLDMMAELGVIPRAVCCQRLGLNVEVWNSNHLFRMRAIKTLFERGYFGPKMITIE